MRNYDKSFVGNKFENLKGQITGKILIAKMYSREN